MKAYEGDLYIDSSKKSKQQNKYEGFSEFRNDKSVYLNISIN